MALARDDPAPFLILLGTAQDGGYPQAGCRRGCCDAAWSNPALRRLVASLAVVDPAGGGRWLIDATPDFREQLRRLDELAPAVDSPGLDGILLTHAHIGHYTGLMQLGREVLGARGVPVHATPRMAAFLGSQAPWEQLVRLGNVSLAPMEADVPIRLGERVTATPFLVPHRSEYSDTVGFRIGGPDRSALYVPDTDGWDAWQLPLEEHLATVDVAYLDGTFFDADELGGRTIEEVPHPTISATLDRLAGLSKATRAKVRFIHLNHTNPALQEGSAALAAIDQAGLALAHDFEVVAL